MYPLQAPALPMSSSLRAFSTRRSLGVLTQMFEIERFAAIFLFALLFLCGQPLLAQGGNPGTPSWGAYDSGSVDTFNIQSLSPVLNIPGMTKSGAFPFTLSFVGGDSYIYSTFYNNTGHLNPGISPVPFSATVNGLSATYPTVYGSYLFPITGVTCPSGDGSGTATEYNGWWISMSDGTKHFLPGISYSGSTCTGGFTATTSDGSGYTATISGNNVISIVASNGMTYTNNAITDSNGNSINYDTGTKVWTDTLGMEALSTASGYQWWDVAGGTPTETITDTATTLKSVFGCSGQTDYSSGSSVPININFPDTSNLLLSWEPTPGYTFPSYTTGRLSEITLRGGGTISYNYNPSGADASGNYGLNCTYLIPKSVTRTTSDGAVTYSSAFSLISGTNYEETVTKLDIEQNKTVYTFTGFTASGPAVGYPQAVTQIQYFINAGTVASPSYSSTPTSQTIYCYNSTATTSSGCPTATVSYPVLEISVFTSKDGISASSASWTQTKFDTYGNVLYSAQYDYGATTPTIATTNTYSPTGSCGPASTVNNKVCTSVTTVNGSTVASSKFTYSSTGNLLTTYQSPNGGSTFLSNPTPNSYNANGTPSVTYNLAGNATTYTYSSAGYTLCTGCSNYPFPTSITAGGLTTNATYYGNGGVKHTQQDPNGNTTTYGYTDPWNRVTSVQDPLGNIAYPAYSPTSIGSTFSFNSGLSVNNTTTTLDGYGRTINKQTQQGPSSSYYDTVSTAYGFAPATAPSWHYVTTNIPCPAGLGAGCAGTNQVFEDMLNRTVWASVAVSGGEYVQTQFSGGSSGSVTREDVLKTLGPASPGENLKQVQKEYDGLGRLTSSCKISTTVSGHTSCGQVTGSYSGVLTTTSYSSTTGSQTVSSTRGSQTHSSTSDGLGRVTSSTTPEGGTISNTYDLYTGGLCGGTYSYPGHLVLKQFANGNGICYTYDPLGRLTSESAFYSGGGASLCRRFFYDSSTGVLGALPTGISPVNSNGRMVEAETDNCVQPVTAATIITDEWFSYDKDGNQTDIWELTPHSTQYYHSTATFAGNNQIATLVLASPSISTEVYGPDGEGRWSSLTSGTKTVVSGTTYNAASQPLTISLGTGTDEDSYTYDLNTGRMKTWTFQVGSTPQTETGQLTWNPNGTLEELQIVDGFNSTGTQTCDYNSSLSSGTGYDDLGRLVGVNCGSAWAQTFSYDQYDNLTKYGSVAWTPGYSSSTNHYTCTGCTYDASGNVTNDSLNAYAWDPFNKMFSVNSSACGTSGECATYDALGRMVEFSKNSTYTENWYTQAGTVVMSGTTLAHAYLGAPGGGTFLEFGGATDYLHKDWLGNARIASLITGQTVGADMAYAPYGEVYNVLAGSGSDWMFTGDVTQLDSGYLFDTPNRELAAANQGRWLSPDPAGAGWNQYAYNTDPLNSIDPTGLFCVWDDGSYDSNDDASSGNSGACGDLGGTWFDASPSDWIDSNNNQVFGSSDWSAAQNMEAYTYAQAINPNGVGDWGTDATTAPSGGLGLSLIPNFYSANLAFGAPLAFSQTISYVPSTNNLYYSPGGGYGAGISLTAGWARGNPNNFAGGASGSLCYFYVVGACGGSTPSGDIAGQIGVGIGGFGFAGGYGVDLIQVVEMGMYMGTPPDPLATVPAGGLDWEDPMMWFQ